MNSESELVGKLRDEKSMVQYSMDVIFTENFIDCREKTFVKENPCGVVWDDSMMRQFSTYFVNKRKTKCLALAVR